jgi:hypothetical protein
MFRSTLTRVASRRCAAAVEVAVTRMTTRTATPAATATATAAATRSNRSLSSSATSSASTAGVALADLTRANPHVDVVRYEHKNRTWSLQHVDYYSTALALGLLDGGLQAKDVVLSWLPAHFSEQVRITYCAVRLFLTFGLTFDLTRNLTFFLCDIITGMISCSPTQTQRTDGLAICLFQSRSRPLHVGGAA